MSMSSSDTRLSMQRSHPGRSSSIRAAIALALSAAAFVACHGASTPVAAGTAPSSKPRVASEPPSDEGYPMCSGQRLSGAAAAGRSGPSELQLAPAFLDEMAACGSADALPDRALPTEDGRINVKGDCEFGNGVSCHFHSGSEFITMSTSKQVDGQGELHCIVPSAEPKSPSVYGGHVKCRNHPAGEARARATSHEVKEGAACSAGIVQQIQRCSGFRCCDDGTLTAPIADLVRDHRNDIRPDFRICSDVLEIDCELLASYTPHTANCPALGGVVASVFAPHQ